MNSEVYWARYSTHIQTNAANLLELPFTVQMDNCPKHTAPKIGTVQDLFRTWKWEILQSGFSVIKDTTEDRKSN